MLFPNGCGCLETDVEKVLLLSRFFVTDRRS